MTDPIKTRGNARYLVAALHVVIAVFLIADAIVRPLYRPLRNWIASFAIMDRAMAAVGRLPRLAILIVFAIPFAIAEPLKVVAFVLISKGSLILGLLLMAFAYLMSFVLVERIYHAGKDKLLTYGWFAWTMKQVGQVMGVVADVKTQTRAWVRSVLGIA